ncbi:hypothetical protein, partial [Streptomyces sanglieri]|uniref:hypothetical protein n=1 Tax=Streptomyces sanglieri TaxID=193460 RepID=UPI0035232D9B
VPTRRSACRSVGVPACRPTGGRISSSVPGAARSGAGATVSTGLRTGTGRPVLLERLTLPLLLKRLVRGMLLALPVVVLPVIVVPGGRHPGGFVGHPSSVWPPPTS